VAIAVGLPALISTATGRDDPLGPVTSFPSLIEVSRDLGEGLSLREGRILFAGPRLLTNSYPYLVAANDAEFAAGRGIELRWTNLHRLFEPLESERAALELVRWMVGGEIVPDRAAFDRLVAAARTIKVPEGAWRIEFQGRVPDHFGLRAVRTLEGFVVRGTIFTTSGYSALQVVEIEARLPRVGAFSLRKERCLTGPPQAWQTSGPDDSESQGRLHAYVSEVRRRLLEALDRPLTWKGFSRALREGWTVAEIVHRFGEPLQDVGSGLHRYVYRLRDRRAVELSFARRYSVPDSARLFSDWSPKDGFGTPLDQVTPARSAAEDGKAPEAGEARRPTTRPRQPR